MTGLMVGEKVASSPPPHPCAKTDDDGPSRNVDRAPHPGLQARADLQARETDVKDRAGEMFIIPGMPRCGTTFLYHNLRKHPHLFLAFMKESNYFSVNYGRGRSWFESLFLDRKPEQLAGDISPYYFLDDDSVERIATFGPEVKLILGMRRPSDVALSLYTQMSVTETMPPFEEFVRSYRFPVGDDHLEVSLESRLFSRMSAAFLERFGANALIYSFDGFRADRLAVMRGIEQFLRRRLFRPA